MSGSAAAAPSGAKFVRRTARNWRVVLPIESPIESPIDKDEVEVCVAADNESVKLPTFLAAFLTELREKDTLAPTGWNTRETVTRGLEGVSATAIVELLETTPEASTVEVVFIESVVLRLHLGASC